VNQATVTLPTDVSLHTVEAGGHVVVSGSVTIPVLTLSSGTLEGPGSVTIPAQGVFRLSYSEVKSVGEVTIAEGGSMIWDVHGELTGSGTLRVASGATVTKRGPGSIGADRAIVNDGTFTMEPGSWIGTSGGNLLNNGTLNLDDTSFLRSSGQFTITNTGTITKTTGNGTAGLGAQFHNDGRLIMSAGSIETGTYESGPGAHVEVHIAGAFSDYGYGQLRTSGLASLDGSLTAVFDPTFIPPAGSKFQVLTYSQRSGTFATVSSATGGPSVNIEYGERAAALVVP
jgi:hypothetical protein